MKIDPVLKQYDPSRYIVYEMVEQTKAIQGIETIQDALPGIYLFKTKPFVNALYNYAHILDGDITEQTIKAIRGFFGNDPFRIKIIVPNDQAEQSLLSHGFTFKDTGNIMVADGIQAMHFESMLPVGVEIRKVVDRQGLDDYKAIFGEAFECTIADTNQKFGFLDGIILDKTDEHMNVFVLYENDEPVSTGAYFAFDGFSVENIGTLNKARGKGYAYEIMKVLLGEAKRLGYAEACLVASDAGARVYQKVGFKLLQKTRTFVL